LSGYRARAPIFPAKKGALHKMDAGTQQKWKDGIGNLLDLSAWYDPSKKVDLRVEDNAKPEIEDIELDTVMGTTDINLLSATSLVAWVGIWLNWLNPPEEARHYSSVWDGDAIGSGHARSMLDSQQAWSAQRPNATTLANGWSRMQAARCASLALSSRAAVCVISMWKSCACTSPMTARRGGK
jgi:hypothetical protein